MVVLVAAGCSSPIKRKRTALTASHSAPNLAANLSEGPYVLGDSDRAGWSRNFTAGNPDGMPPFPDGFWTPSRQEEFGSDLLRFFAACGVSWHAANNPESRRFFGKWIPGVQVPDRRKLSGTYLDKATALVQDRTVALVQGKYATGQSDGWRNVRKINVITTMMTVSRQVSRHKVGKPTADMTECTTVPLRYDFPACI